MAMPKRYDKDTIALLPEQWEYLSLYNPTGNRSEQAREAVEALQRMRPAGPNAFGHTITRRGRRVPKAVKDWAGAHGVSTRDALIELASLALKKI